MLRRERGPFERTRNHWWWRDGWGPGVRYLTWHLTFEDAPELHATARRAAPQLSAVSGVDAVPVPWLHLTMTGVGFADRVEPGMVDAVARSVVQAASALSVTPVVFELVHVYREGVALSSATPWLQDLRALQLDIVADAGGDVPAQRDPFRPHVTLAYFSTEIDEPTLDAALDRAELTETRVTTPRLSLLELGRDDRVYTWRVVAQTTLDATAR